MKPRYTAIAALVLLAGCHTPLMNTGFLGDDITVCFLSRGNGPECLLGVNSITAPQFGNVVQKIARDFPDARPRLVLCIQKGIPFATIAPFLESAQNLHMTNVVVRFDQVCPHRFQRAVTGLVCDDQQQGVQKSGAPLPRDPQADRSVNGQER